MNRRFAQLLNIAFMQHYKEQKMKSYGSSSVYQPNQPLRTMVTADIEQPAPLNTKEFRHFAVGDFIASAAGNLAVKINDTQVRWLIKGNVGAKENDVYDHNPYTVLDPHFHYIVPTRVHVNVWV
jgi:hypothetical protein